VVGEDSDEINMVFKEQDIIDNLRKIYGRNVRQEEIARGLYRVIAGGKRKSTKVENLKRATMSLVKGLGHPLSDVDQTGA